MYCACTRIVCTCIVCVHVLCVYMYCVYMCCVHVLCVHVLCVYACVLCVYMCCVCTCVVCTCIACVQVSLTVVVEYMGGVLQVHVHVLIMFLLFIEAVLISSDLCCLLLVDHCVEVCLQEQPLMLRTTSNPSWKCSICSTNDCNSCHLHDINDVCFRL